MKPKSVLPPLARRYVNPSTRRSREHRERVKLNRRDPLKEFQVWLPESKVALLALGLKTPRPEDAYNSIDEKQWRREIEQAIRDIVEEKCNAVASTK